MITGGQVTPDHRNPVTRWGLARAAGHRLACQQAAGHPQRVTDGLFGFEQRLVAFELPHG
jgi:hypothetical protein